MPTYIPHSDRQIQHMLDTIGADSVQQLFSHIDGVSVSQGPDNGLSEEELRRYFDTISSRNVRGLSFLGFGSYSHIIPSAVSALSSLPQFVTSYTPYQAELSQGYLQAIFEFQSYICTLTGLDVSNASLYDGHSAAVEAIALMLRAGKKKNAILVSSTLHPFTLSVIRTYAELHDISVTEIPQCNRCCDLDSLKAMVDDRTAGVLVQSPNRYGYIEDYTGAAEVIHTQGALFSISSDPLSLVLQKNCRDWNADIAIGDTQVFGLPLSFGGATCGYMSVARKLMRKIPGRIVGQTVDSEGNRAFCLTLQAREQHITRYRSTSNICSNHAHAALMSTIYLAIVGKSGLQEAAVQSYDKAHYLHDRLKDIPDVMVIRENPFFCEFPLIFPTEDEMERVLDHFLKHNIFAGVPLYRYTEQESDRSTLLVAVTEKHTREQLDEYVGHLREVLK